VGWDALKGVKRGLPVERIERELGRGPVLVRRGGVRVKERTITEDSIVGAMFCQASLLCSIHSKEVGVCNQASESGIWECRLVRFESCEVGREKSLVAKTRE